MANRKNVAQPPTTLLNIAAAKKRVAEKPSQASTRRVSKDPWHLKADKACTRLLAQLVLLFQVSCAKDLNLLKISKCCIALTACDYKSWPETAYRISGLHGKSEFEASDSVTGFAAWVVEKAFKGEFDEAFANHFSIYLDRHCHDARVLRQQMNLAVKASDEKLVRFAKIKLGVEVADTDTIKEIVRMCHEAIELKCEYRADHPVHSEKGWK